MHRDTQIALLERLLAQIEAGGPEIGASEAEIAAWTYTDPARAAAEVKALFRRNPLVLGHASRLAAPGDFFTLEALGLPLLATRDREGVAHAFLNVCRHRGTRVAPEPCGQQRKAFVCPYHGWTYDLAGRLTHVPQPEGFPNLDRSRRGLVELPLVERHGLLWIHPIAGAALDVPGFLGPVDDDLAGMGLCRHRVYRHVADRKRTNWKLVIDAFLEGYHLQHLHRKTLHRFFKRFSFVYDHLPPHLRVLSSRTDMLELRARDRCTWNMRTSSTLFYFLFPSTILLFHPDFVSLMRVLPDGPDHCLWLHEMLIPEEDDTPDKQEHWQRSYALIEETVFQQEDLWAAESIQAGLRAGANETLLLGRYELMIRHFHDQIEAAIAAAGDPPRID